MKVKELLVYVPVNAFIGIFYRAADNFPELYECFVHEVPASLLNREISRVFVNEEGFLQIDVL